MRFVCTGSWHWSWSFWGPEHRNRKKARSACFGKVSCILLTYLWNSILSVSLSPSSPGLSFLYLHLSLTLSTTQLVRNDMGFLLNAGMALSSIYSTAILWLSDHSTPCLAVTIQLIAIHLMSLFEASIWLFHLTISCINVPISSVIFLF